MIFNSYNNSSNVGKPLINQKTEKSSAVNKVANNTGISNTISSKSANTTVLSLKGVGWRANVNPSGDLLVLSVGASHPVVSKIPTGLTVVISSNLESASSRNVQDQGKGGKSPAKDGRSEGSAQGDGTNIIISGPSKIIVGDYAARLQNIRRWNPYTGHGISVVYTFNDEGINIANLRERKVGKRK